MTVTTYVALRGPIDADTAFVLALQALLTAGGQRDRFDSARSRAGVRNGITVIHTVPEQGLPGITQAEANEDGTQLDLNARLEESLAGWDLVEQSCNALVSWDTELGYRGPIRGNAEHLHAAAIVLLEDSLPADVELRWRYEATAEWHFSIVGLRKLTRSVLPSVVVASHIRARHDLNPVQ